MAADGPAGEGMTMARLIDRLLRRYGYVRVTPPERPQPGRARRWPSPGKHRARAFLNAGVMPYECSDGWHWVSAKHDVLEPLTADEIEHVMVCKPVGHRAG